MNDKPCVITINGSDYYYPCDYHDYILHVGNSLINVGSNSITLYRDFAVYGDGSVGYPRITMPTNTKAYIRQSQNGNYSTLVVNSVEFKTASYSFSVYLMIVLIGVMILNLFKR